MTSYSRGPVLASFPMSLAFTRPPHSKQPDPIRNARPSQDAALRRRLACVPLTLTVEFGWGSIQDTLENLANPLLRHPRKHWFFQPSCRALEMCSFLIGHSRIQVRMGNWKRNIPGKPFELSAVEPEKVHSAMMLSFGSAVLEGAAVHGFWGLEMVSGPSPDSGLSNCACSLASGI